MKKTAAPDFFLASSDSIAFRGPFKCWILESLNGEIRNDYLLVRVDPPAIDYSTRLPIETVVLAGRITPTNPGKLPQNVYIAKITDESLLSSLRCSGKNIEVVASGDIFATWDAAAALARECL